MPTVLLSSWMVKQGAVRKSWKRRWFVLDSLGQLRYYKAEAEAKPLGIIDLTTVQKVLAAERCRVEWPEEADSNLCFALVTPRRIWNMYCDDYATFKQWMNHIRKASHIGAAIPLGNPVTAGTDTVQLARTQSVSATSLAGKQAKQSDLDLGLSQPNAGSQGAVQRSHTITSQTAEKPKPKPRPAPRTDGDVSRPSVSRPAPAPPSGATRTRPNQDQSQEYYSSTSDTSDADSD